MRRKLILIFIFFLVFLSVISTAHAFMSPSQLVEISTDIITQRTNYTFQVKNISNYLYLYGGVIEPQGAIFAEVSPEIYIGINTMIESDQSLQINGETEVNLFIVADKLWNKKYPIRETVKYSTKTTSDNEIIAGEFTIPLRSIINLIEQIENDIKIRSGEYKLQILPAFNGVITHPNGPIAFDSSHVIELIYSNGRVALPEQTEFIKETKFETESVIPVPYQWLNFHIPIVIARVFLLSLTVLLALIAFYLLINQKFKNRLVISEFEKIEKKHRDRIISVKHDVGKESLKPLLILDSFRSLLQISDEKELPILKQTIATEKEVTFYVIDGNNIYGYQTSMS